MSERLEEMLRIARAAERSRGCYPVEMYATTPFALAFNPRTAEALVEVALAAAKLLQVGKTSKYADCEDCCVENGVVEALSALTSAMEDNSNVG